MVCCKVAGNYDLLEKIGEGSFGNVYNGVANDNFRKVLFEMIR